MRFAILLVVLVLAGCAKKEAEEIAVVEVPEYTIEQFLATTAGPVYGGFQAEQEHVARKTSKGEQVVLKEIYWVVSSMNWVWMTISFVTSS
mgnify:CR=1 FL=1